MANVIAGPNNLIVGGSMPAAGLNPPMASALDSLDYETEDLRGLVGQLESKLSGLISPNQEVSDSNTSKTSADEYSPIVNRLNSSGKSIAQSRQRLRDLLSSLDV